MSISTVNFVMYISLGLAIVPLCHGPGDPSTNTGAPSKKMKIKKIPNVI